MTQSVIKNRLISFQNYCNSTQQKKCHEQAYNSLMIKFDDIQNYQQIQDFTHCQNLQCGMVLTVQDHNYIDDWNWVQSNKKHYDDIKEKIQQMQKNKWNYYIWNCRFCGFKNLIQKSKTIFAKNKSKVVLRQGIKQSQKICDSPLLLFLIDGSSSMQQQILETQSNYQSKNNKQQFLTIGKLKNTQIYKKISQNQKSILQKLKKQIDPDSKDQVYKDHLSKYKVLMALTQTIINQIKEGKNQSQLKLATPGISRKIGFMFFNSQITLQKMSSNKQTKAIKVSHKQFQNNITKQNQQFVDFQNFTELFNLGKKHSVDYGKQLQTFNFHDIDVNNMVPSGQTALGPAISIASGIVSGYSSGSLIIIVTDGKANKGIFTHQQNTDIKQKKLLRLRLQKARAQICLLKLQNNPQKKDIILSPLQKIFKKNILNVMTNNKAIDQLYKKLSIIIQGSLNSNKWTNQIKIKCQNPNIRYDKTSINKMKKKLFNDKKIQFITPQILSEKFTSFDYNHPFLTQFLILYQDLVTKKQCKFMAFVKQKIVKIGNLQKKDQQQLGSIDTLKNVLNYLQAEGQRLDLNNIPLSVCKISFRSIIMQSYKYSSLQAQFKKQIMNQQPQIFKQKRPPRNAKQMINQYRFKQQQQDDKYQSL